MMSLVNKVAIVTGGGRGLGRNTAICLGGEGASVIVTYRSNRTEAESAVAELEAMGREATALPLDCADIASFGAFAARVRETLKIWSRTHFDYLINNGGSHRRGRIDEVEERDFDYLCNVHFKGVLFLTQQLLPLLTDGGRIVNVSSALTRFITPGSTNSIVYASMKGAVEVMTRYLAQDLAQRGIRANVVAPGAIGTDFGGAVVRDNPEINRLVAANTALGRVGVPGDIGPMIASLVSEANRWVTGERIEVSGGMFL
jgi:NAD(P)-dependent dehydrogenase (short-subunit alcohol dehydrogenase family)